VDRYQREIIARTCHEANRVLQSLTGEAMSPSWEDALEFNRAVTFSRVDSILDHWEVYKGTARELAEVQHNEWMRYMASEGWVKGDRKDATAKTHPLMVPFAELSSVDQAKDVLFVTIVQALAPHL
jgi:hypothetical protein